MVIITVAVAFVIRVAARVNVAVFRIKALAPSVLSIIAIFKQHGYTRITTKGLTGGAVTTTHTTKRDGPYCSMS